MTLGTYVTLTYTQMRTYVSLTDEEVAFEAKNGYENDRNSLCRKRNPAKRSYFYQIDLESDGEVDIEGWLYISY